MDYTTKHCLRIKIVGTLQMLQLQNTSIATSNSASVFLDLWEIIENEKEKISKVSRIVTRSSSQKSTATKSNSSTTFIQTTTPLTTKKKKCIIIQKVTIKINNTEKKKKSKQQS
jgi:hypothetical protein